MLVTKTDCKTGKLTPARKNSAVAPKKNCPLGFTSAKPALLGKVLQFHVRRG